MKKDNRIYFLVLLGMCGLIGTALGMITNIAGIFLTPIAEEFGILRGSVSLTLTISNFAFAIGGMCMPKFFKEKYLKRQLILVTAVLFLSSVGLGLAPNIYVMYILNAIRGFAGGLIGLVFITLVINNWFYERVGLMTSIALSFTGLSGALFSYVITYVISTSSWRTGFIVVGIIMVVLNLPAILFLPSLKPETKGYIPYGTKTQEETQQVSKAMPINQFLFILCCIVGYFASSSTTLTQHFPGLASYYQHPMIVGTTMLSLSMIANSLGKIILGALIDQFGSKKPILFFYFILCASTISLALFHSPIIMYISAFFYGFIYSIANIAMVTMTKDLFGRENYSKTYPTFAMCGTIGTAVLASLIGYIYDFTHSYIPVLMLLLTGFIINTCIVLYCYRKQR